MNSMKTLLAVGLISACLAPLSAHAAFVLDTGTPTGSGMPSVLDGNDYYAAEFTLGSGQTISSIQAYIEGGPMGNPGDTFTLALYVGSKIPQMATPVFSAQASYQEDGWNGLSHLNLTGLAAGTYWAAIEVGSADSTTGLLLPTVAGGASPALAYAFNAGSGYTTQGASSFGMQVQVEPVPVPAAFLLFGSGLLGLGGAVARRKPLCA